MHRRARPLRAAGKTRKKAAGGVEERQNKEETTTTKKRNKRLFNGQTKTSIPFLFLGPRAIVPSVVRLFFVGLGRFNFASISAQGRGREGVLFRRRRCHSSCVAGSGRVGGGREGGCLRTHLIISPSSSLLWGRKRSVVRPLRRWRMEGGQGRLFSPTDLGGENGRVSLGGRRRSEKRRRKKNFVCVPLAPILGIKQRKNLTTNYSYETKKGRERLRRPN